MITMTAVPKDSAMQWFIMATACAGASNVDDSI